MAAPIAATGAAPAPSGSPETVTAEQQRKLAEELEGMELATLGSGTGADPPPDVVTQRFIAAANARDARALEALSTESCVRGECGSLGAQAGTKFSLTQVGGVDRKGSRAAASADAMCGSRKCDSLHLLLELSNRGWQVADVTESDEERATWLAGPSTAATPGTPGKVSGPKAEASVGSITGGSDVANRDRVIAAARAGMRACLQRELEMDPSSPGGAVTLIAEVNAGGTVTGASSSELPSSNELAGCLRLRVRRMIFAPPHSGKATIRFVVQLSRRP